jgi:hypothetical protein
MANDHAAKALMEALGTYLKGEIRSLKQVLYDFPAPNVVLQYPSLSIISGNPEFAPESNPYILEQGEMNAATKKADVDRVVGTYEFKLQLDFWCRDKVERFKIYDEFFKAFHREVDPMGLNLQLSKYYDVWCRYDQIGYQNEDSEISSQRAEWRVIINVLAQCKAVLGKSEFIMETIVNTLTTPNTIEIEED